jgi:hypothetical protein
MSNESLKIKFSKVCSVTGEGMNEGYYAKLDGKEYYFKYTEDATFWCLYSGFNSIDEAFDKDVIEYIEWVDGDAGTIDPYIKSCREEKTYHLEVVFNDDIYKVQCCKINDEWFGYMKTFYVSDEYGYAIDEGEYLYNRLVEFVKTVKCVNES